jgi:hypothetical protein
VPVGSNANLGHYPLIAPPDLVGGHPAMLDQALRHGYHRHLVDGVKDAAVAQKVDSH